MKLSSFGNVHAAGAIVAALVFMACADSASNTSGTNAPGTDGTSTADSVAATDVAGIADVAVTPDTGGTDSAVLQDIAALPDIANFGGSSDLEAAPDSAPPTDVVAPEDTAATDTTAALDTTATADTATDAAAPPADVSSTTTWFPSWKDEQGCEHWQYFDATTKTCISDNPSREAAEADCWHFGQVNAFGIGKPCKPGEVSCAGQTANLIPDTAYARARMTAIFGNATRGTRAASRGPAKFERDDPLYVASLRTTKCDAAGSFSFPRVPDGVWYVTTSVKWPSVTKQGPAQQVEGGSMMQRLDVRGRRLVKVTLP